MNKTSLIIRREYLTRVRKRSFIIMTILGPLLMAAIMIVPIYVSQLSGEEKKIAVLDETGLFYHRFTDTENMKFSHVYGALDTEKAQFRAQEYYALLYVPKTELSVPNGAFLYSDKQPNINVKTYIQDVMKKEIETLKLQASGIDQDILESVKTKVSLVTIKLDDGGKEEKSYTELSMVIGLFSGILIYFFIFLFGSQVMRGVIEEKTNRIVEVIVSSVKPFQLMLGKIIGIALVGLTQFGLWVILTFGIVTAFQSAYADKIDAAKAKEMLMKQAAPMGTQAADTQEAVTEDNGVGEVFAAIQSVNFLLIIGSFLFFFLGGYLLYAALFAAIGAAVDNEADTQQFMLPVTVPLILAIVMGQFVINNPEGPASFWFSIIPFTSPIIMMIRIPFGVPLTDLILSMALLVLGFLATTWFAAKIYRTGILMYGKKVDYKELWKWIRY
ncbi:MAG TPA: ABC transporter permease [Bacteroidales bacterium]|nr:ABC transporter permease [Bacteroidales bacterium]HSA44269.1 ABC transporter permease [Bacteroidales bacterium]